MNKKTIFNKIIKAIGKLLLFSVSGKPCKKNKTNDAVETGQNKKLSEKKTVFNWLKEKINKHIIHLYMSSRLGRLRKGDTAEYLSQTILSSIAFSNPVYRQEDYGIDFTCSLIDKVEKTGKNKQIYEKLYPNETFHVQVKSGTKKVEYKNIPTNNLDWLFKSKTPILFCYLDLDKKTMFFYSISQIHYLTARRDTMYEKLIIKFLTSTDNTQENTFDNNNVNNTREISLGEPFMTICIDDILDKNKLSKKKSILRRVIQIEEENILYRRLHLPVMRWLYKYKTNELSSFEFGWNHLCVKDKDEQINIPNDIKTHIGQLLITLCKSYELQGVDDYNKSLREIIQELPFYETEIDGNKYFYHKFLPELGFTDENGKPIDK